MLIRHGIKMWNNKDYLKSSDCIPHLDPPVIPGWKVPDNVIDSLRKLAPRYIYTSPLQRCRDTAELLRRECSAKVVVDPNLGEFFQYPVSEDLDNFDSQTLKYYSPMMETMKDLEDRVTRLNLSFDSVYVTHGIVIEKIIGFVPYTSYHLLSEDEVMINHAKSIMRLTRLKIDDDPCRTLKEFSIEVKSNDFESLLKVEKIPRMHEDLDTYYVEDPYSIQDRNSGIFIWEPNVCEDCWDRD